MTAGYLDLFAEQGASFNTSVTLTDASGNALNLMNYLVAAQMKKSYISQNVIATFTIVTPNPTNGEILLQLPYQTTQNIFPLRYVYDVMIRNTTSNLASRILEGTIYVDAGVTPSP